MARKDPEQNAVRRYLLNQLSPSEQETVELRLLSDETFSEELQIVEDELIDDYLAGELSSDERARFEEIFLANGKRQRKLQAGEAIKRYFGTIPAPPSPKNRFASLRNWFSGRFRFSPPLAATLAVLAIAIVGLVIWRAAFYQSSLEKGLVALNEAYRQGRPVEARVSNLDYAPFITTRGEPPARANTLERRRAEGLLSEAFTEDANAESYHALGQMYLLQKNFDKAIENLEQAKRADAKNAQIHADLGAAYLERGKLALADGPGGGAAKGREDLERSLDNLKQALQLSPNLREVLFNRALVHQYQGRYVEAEADWRAYLQQDSNSQWANEVQQRLRLLEDLKSR